MGIIEIFVRNMGMKYDLRAEWRIICGGSSKSFNIRLSRSTYTLWATGTLYCRLVGPIRGLASERKWKRVRKRKREKA